MFNIKKLKPEKVDITLSELIDKYVGKNLINIDYKENGTVSVWIPQDKKQEIQDES